MEVGVVDVGGLRLKLTGKAGAPRAKTLLVGTIVLPRAQTVEPVGGGAVEPVNNIPEEDRLPCEVISLGDGFPSSDDC